MHFNRSFNLNTLAREHIQVGDLIFFFFFFTTVKQYNKVTSLTLASDWTMKEQQSTDEIISLLFPPPSMFGRRNWKPCEKQ